MKGKDWRDMTLPELEVYLKRLKVALAVLDCFPNREAIRGRANAVARVVAELNVGREVVRLGDILPQHSTNRGTGRGQKDRVASELARHGMVGAYGMDSGEGEEAGK